MIGVHIQIAKVRRPLKRVLSNMACSVFPPGILYCRRELKSDASVRVGIRYSFYTTVVKCHKLFYCLAGLQTTWEFQATCKVSQRRFWRQCLCAGSECKVDRQSFGECVSLSTVHTLLLLLKLYVEASLQRGLALRHFVAK